jgi:hypothetical protein
VVSGLGVFPFSHFLVLYWVSEVSWVLGFAPWSPLAQPSALLCSDSHTLR